MTPTLNEQTSHAFRKLLHERITFGDVAELMKIANPDLTDADLRTAKHRFVDLKRLVDTVSCRKPTQLELKFDKH